MQLAPVARQERKGSLHSHCRAQSATNTHSRHLASRRCIRRIDRQPRGEVKEAA
jgi:hypothetical protein